MSRIGTVLESKYEIRRPIGKGGMGFVYEAFHLGLKKRVAVKFLQPRHLDDEVHVTRFLREAQAAAAIGHDGIIDVHDIGIDDLGVPYIVMELLDGVNLKSYLRTKGFLGESTTSYIACQILSALVSTHSRGIIHRDIKPANIFLTDRGRPALEVKLLDFGISKVSGPTNDDDSLTSTGAAVGTARYMSPEQARGDEALDHRADIYAVGVVMYECLTGVVPYDGRSRMEIIDGILSAAAAWPSTVIPGISSAVEQIVMTALAKNPSERFDSALEFLTALLPAVDAKQSVLISRPEKIRGVTGMHPIEDDADQDLTTVERKSRIDMTNPTMSAEATMAGEETVQLDPPRPQIEDFASLDTLPATSLPMTVTSLPKNVDVGFEIGRAEAGTTVANADTKELNPHKPVGPVTVGPNGADSSTENVRLDPRGPGRAAGSRRLIGVVAVIVLVAVLVGGAAIVAYILDVGPVRSTASGQPASIGPIVSSTDGGLHSQELVRGDVRREAISVDGGGGVESAADSEISQTTMVGLEIDVLPRHSKIFIDGLEVRGNPFVGEFPRDAESHTIVARARRHEEWSEEVPFDRDQRFRAVLQRVRQRAGSRIKSRGRTGEEDPWDIPSRPSR